ncbi:MAG TPA: nucleotidyltransferase domain-containing protein [Patescibacteria group bacterium]|nr:nucleotidyltransferase domain-containing protein [Patescibacteria group bacterium]
MTIQQFYKQTQPEIVDLFRSFLEDDMFTRYPQLRGKISVVITGSVPSGHYDEYSDIDTEFFYSNEKDRTAMNSLVKEYKKSLLAKKIPVQFHPAKTFVELKKEHLAGWEHDDSLREYSMALVVLDPGNRFKKIQSTIAWYPKDILREKIQWLFAEAVFHFEDRFKIAVKRDTRLYSHSVEVHIIKLLGNAILLSQGKYSVFEKHLLTELSTAKEKVFCQKVESLLGEVKLDSMEKGLKDLLSYTEKRLNKAGWIQKKPIGHWITLRPKYRVEHCG